MPTNKKRISVILPDDAKLLLSHAAKRDGIREAAKAAQLIELALEIEEDQVWNRIASERDTNDAKFFSHAEAWA